MKGKRESYLGYWALKWSSQNIGMPYFAALPMQYSFV